MCHHRQRFAVGLDSQAEASHPHPPVVAFHPSLVLQVVRGAPGVETARPQRPAGTVGNHVRPGVAGVEVPAAVRPGNNRVKPVIVVVSAEAGQQHVFLVG